jgi:hypothetical protein
MSAERDVTIDEKRVYGDRHGRSELFVASEAGLVRVAVSGDRVGEFGLAHRGAVADVATGGGLAVATDEDVLVGRPDEDGGLELEPTGFGPATAVSTRSGLVATDGNRVAAFGAEGWDEREGPGDVRALDGTLVAAADGIYRLDGTPLGLGDVRDVAAAGTPLAATGEGLYHLGNGWMRAISGAFSAVDGGERWAHAVGDDGLYRMGEDPEAWTRLTVPVAGVVGAVGGETTYAVTADGTLLAEDGADGWRERSLGVRGVRGLALVS